MDQNKSDKKVQPSLADCSKKFRLNKGPEYKKKNTFISNQSDSNMHLLNHLSSEEIARKRSEEKALEKIANEKTTLRLSSNSPLTIKPSISA